MKLSEKELEIIEILEKDARTPIDVLAKMVDLPVEETEALVKKLEEAKVIVQYTALIDWRKADGREGVTAMIDVKVTPKRGVGFDEVAERIYRFPEVKSVYLMSGAYDLSVVIEGRSMAEIAQFVSEKLSTLDSVISTTTHFILKNTNMTASSLTKEIKIAASWCRHEAANEKNVRVQDGCGLEAIRHPPRFLTLLPAWTASFRSASASRILSRPGAFAKRAFCRSSKAIRRIRPTPGSWSSAKKSPLICAASFMSTTVRKRKF